MIKFFKIFINMLYAGFTMGMIALVAWGANWMVNTGGDTADVPNLVSNVEDDTNTIYFRDIISFDMVSISNATRSHEVIIGGTDETILFDAIPVRWANVAMTWLKNVSTAVFSPSYEIEQMERYRYAMFVTKVIPDDPTSDVYVVIDPFIEITDSTGMMIQVRIDKLNYRHFDTYGIVYGSHENPIEIGDEFSYSEVEAQGKMWKYDTPVPDLSLNDEPTQFNEISKYDKYNREEYNQFEKFLINKTVVKWAFAEIIMIMVLTGFVVYQNPIDFTKDENSGVTEINRSFFPRIPTPKRRIPRRYREYFEEDQRYYRKPRKRKKDKE